MSLRPTVRAVSVAIVDVKEKLAVELLAKPSPAVPPNWNVCEPSLVAIFATLTTLCSQALQKAK